MKRGGYSTRPSKTSRKEIRRRNAAQFKSDRITSDLIINSFSISTAVQLIMSPFDPLLKATTGQLATFPQVMEPYMAGLTGIYDFHGKIRVIRLQFRFNIVGSQSNTIAAGDLFNRFRLIIFYTQSNYLGGAAFNVPTIDSPPDTRDALILHDKVYDLSSTAFDSLNNYNVPACKTVDLNIFENRNFELFSTSGGVTWDTRRGNYYVYAVSDSVVAPNPTITGHCRLIYRMCK